MDLVTPVLGPVSLEGEDAGVLLASSALTVPEFAFLLWEYPGLGPAVRAVLTRLPLFFPRGTRYVLGVFTDPEDGGRHLTITVLLPPSLTLKEGLAALEAFDDWFVDSPFFEVGRLVVDVMSP